MSGRDEAEPADGADALGRPVASVSRHGAQILNGLSEGVIVQDQQGRVEHLNRAARELLGLTEAQINLEEPLAPGWSVSREDGSPFGPDELPAPRALATGVGQRDVVIGVTHPGGRSTWLKVTAEPIFSVGDPVPQGTITTFVDITGFRVTEDALREAEARYRALIENSPDLLAVLEPDGRLRYASAAAQRILGLSPASFEGLNVFGLLHPDEVESVVASFLDTSQREGVNERLELRLRRADGTYAPVEIVANNLLADPVVRGIVMTIRDLTDRYRAEDALLTSTFRLRTLIDSLPAAVLVEGMDGRVAIANTRLITLFDLGGSAFDLVGTSADAVHRSCAVHAVDPEQYLPRADQIRRSDEDVTDEIVLLADGRTLERDYRPIRIDGVVRERMWVYYDVTPHMAAAALMREGRDEALEALGAKSQFLAMLSHEVRTPMNGIIGLLDLLRDRSAALDDEIVEILSGVRSAADSLMDVLDDSLDVAKIESGQLELQSVDFDIQEVVETAAETMGSLARDRDVALTTWVDPSLPRLVTGDPGRLRQVLLNLVGNALRFTEGGEVTIRAVFESPSDSGGLAVRLTVTDTGAGIDPTQLDTLFEPFTQAGTDLDRSRGTGLGLAISRRLAELMGGQIGAVSQPGRGSTFWFTIDVAAAGAVAPVLVAEVDSVLVVTGREATAQILADQLRSWGVAAVATLHPDQIGSVELPIPQVLLATDDLGSALDPLIGPATRVVLLGCGTERSVLSRAHLLTMPVRSVRLFAAVNGVAGARPTSATDQAAPFTGRVLLAEDNEVNRRIAGIALTRLGLEVDAVGDGQEAVDAVQVGRYDLVLMDCQMPILDGFAATREIRRLEQERGGARLPIVALTASALQEDFDACIAAGMDSYLTKPITGDGLREGLRPWLDPAARPGGGGSPFAAPGSAPGAAPEPEPEAEQPAVDADIISGLAEELGERSIMAEVLAAYLRELPVRRDGIVAAAASGDTDTVRNISHTLKSSSAALGALPLSEICARIEAAAREADTAEIGRAVGTLVSRCGAAEIEIKRWYRRLVEDD